ncbi:hypothetical protein KVE37_00295 [Helicobacter pylori]|nr:hypothetical protein KVE37_00295 [Helicobacter pylori]
MSGAHIVENTNNEKIEKPNIPNPTVSTPPPPNNEELLKSITDLKDRIKKLEDLKLEDFEPLRKLSHFIGNLFGKSSNDTQENPKDAQKCANFQEKYTKPIETTELVEKNQNLTADKERLERESKNLTTGKENLTKEKTDLTNKNAELQKQVQALE